MIGLFLNNFFGEYQARVWDGAAAAAAELGLRLVSFAEDSFWETGIDYRASGRMYDCASPELLDGVILLSPPVVRGEARTRWASFLERFSSRPAVHVGVDDDSLACVVPENYRGMRELVDHFIEKHHRSRIAFIRGPGEASDAEQRFAAYRDALRDHGIPYRPSLILDGDFNREAGIAAGARLADSVEEFDAVVGANDYMALYAVKELRRRGVRVPDDVSVGGFDDFRASRSSVPALCTVHQPMREIGEAALRMVASMARGGYSGPRRLAFPTSLVLRRSCGCAVPGSPEAEAPRERALLCGDEELAAIASALRRGELPRFRALLEAAVAEAYERGVPVSSWRGLVPGMAAGLGAEREAEARREALDFLSALQDEINDRAMLALIEEKSAFDQLSSRLIGSFDASAIRDFLDAEILSRSDFLCVSLYEEDGSARAFYCTDKRLEGLAFEPELLAPGGAAGLPDRGDLLLLPLRARGERLGFMTCLAGRSQPGYFEVLRRHLSGALEGARLVARTRGYSARLESEVRERTAELARVVAELEETNRRLEEQSSLDEMTGLYNRRGFFELAGKQVELARRRGADFLLIFVDVDSLKRINDQYGHAEGDAAIKALAGALSSSFRQTDVVARLGGDEFTILAIDTSMRECEKMIARARAIVAERNEGSGLPYRLSFSYGAAASGADPGRGLDELMAEADGKLYGAKRARGSS